MERETQKWGRVDVAAPLDAMVADDERSTDPRGIEEIVPPEAFRLLSGALKQARFALSGLEVDARRMRQVLAMTNGLVVSDR